MNELLITMVILPMTLFVVGVSTLAACGQVTDAHGRVLGVYETWFPGFDN